MSLQHVSSTSTCFLFGGGLWQIYIKDETTQSQNEYCRSLLQLTTYFSIVCWDNAVFVIRFRNENQLFGVSSLGWHRHDWRCFNFLVKISGICIWKLSRVRLSLTNVETQSQSAVTNSTTIPSASWNEGPLVMLVHRRQHRVVCGILNEHLIQATWPRSNMTLCLRRTGTHWSDCFINCITPLDS